MSSEQDDRPLQQPVALPTTLPQQLKRELTTNGRWSTEAQNMFVQERYAIFNKKRQQMEFYLIKTGEKLTVRWYPCGVRRGREIERNKGLLLATGPSFQEPRVIALGSPMRYYVWLGKEDGFAGEDWDIVKKARDPEDAKTRKRSGAGRAGRRKIELPEGEQRS